jgi:cobaltochelatase CobS
VYLYGKAGTGKTTLAKKIASFLLQRETFVINCNQFTSPIDIIGGQTIEGYKQGRLCLAWQTGGVLILDELPKLDPNTAGLLNEALAESAAQDRISEISKEEYDKLKKQLEESKRELGFDVMSEGKKYMRVDYPTITDGRGVKLRKNKNFACIGTGNTNMKEISQNFSGNNRQDYSLVDRFAGSFYYIDYDNALEQKLTYKKVYDISVLIRNILDSGNSVESVSLRTMLNFNRIYEQQGLRKIKSKYAIPPIMINGKPMAKTLADSLESFIDTLPDATRQNIIDNTGVMDMAIADIDDDEFIKEWHRIHGEGEENSPEPFTAKW